MTEFTGKVITVLKNLDKGQVVTYGQVAAMAGNPRGARQVSRILHSCSKKYGLPWHRIVNSEFRISLLPGQGFEEQCFLLREEGLEVTDQGQVIIGFPGN